MPISPTDLCINIKTANSIICNMHISTQNVTANVAVVANIINSSLLNFDIAIL